MASSIALNTSPFPPERVDLSPYFSDLEQIDGMLWKGRVVQLVGLLVESKGPAVAAGNFCEIHTSSGRVVRTAVVGFHNGNVLSVPLEETDGISLGDMVVARPAPARVRVGPGLLGRVLNGFGEPMDQGGRIHATDQYDLFAVPPGALEREPITEPLVTGIRSIDGLLACGKGQRIGLFGGSGVGKSTLLGAMAQRSSADVTVMALIGERNREVRTFIEDDLGPEGRKRSVVVVSTSDRPAPLRIRACYVALAVAEYFRDQGANVLLVIDSVTRLAMAQREIGLAAGEPPSQKGYTPSVFSMMPKIFERAGNFQRGSITGFFTVLVEGDDFNEPICDAARAILDGHIVLSRRLANAGHYPAIDVLESVSRLAPKVSSRDHQAQAQRIREALATYRHSEDIIQLGAYVAGLNPKLDASIQLQDRLNDFLRQSQNETAPYSVTLERIAALANALP